MQWLKSAVLEPGTYFHGTYFQLKDSQIKRIEKYMNMVPRKMFGYKTPYEVYYNKKVALVF